MMEHSSKSRANIFLLSFVGIVALASVVLAVITADAVWPFVGALIVIGSVSIGLAWIGVVMFGRIAKARGDLNSARYDFLIAMARQGALPTDGSFAPIQRQIETPSEPEGGSLFGSDVEQYRLLALELIGVTHSKLGPQSKQVIPFNKCATEKITPFDDVNAWTNARGWLLNHGLAWKDMRGEKCMGIYFSNGQTVADVYRKMTST